MRTALEDVQLKVYQTNFFVTRTHKHTDTTEYIVRDFFVLVADVALLEAG